MSRQQFQERSTGLKPKGSPTRSFVKTEQESSYLCKFCCLDKVSSLLGRLTSVSKRISRPLERPDRTVMPVILKKKTSQTRQDRESKQPAVLASI